MPPIVGSEGDRVRSAHAGTPNAAHGPLTFVNPYPWMSAPEAMVHLALEEHSVPFSWRWFDGYAPTFTQLMGNNGYQPEFTLVEYKLVILVIGAFFGTLPGAIDNTALATVTLQADGWTVAALFTQDIERQGPWDLLKAAVPSLGSITGPVRPNPYGHPLLMTSNLKHHARTFQPKLYHFRVRSDINGEPGHAKRTLGRPGRRFGDSGRTRSERVGAVSGRRKAR